MGYIEMILQRIQNQNRVYVADVVQLSEEMPDLFDFIANWLGVSVAEVKDSIANTVVTAEPFISDFLNWNQKYSRAMYPRPTYAYRLDGHTPVPEPDVLKWGQWFESHNDERIVAQTSVKGCRVSTAFLGLNHQFGEGPPILFETMVFGGELNEYQARYATWDEAVQGHEHLCALIGLK